MIKKYRYPLLENAFSNSDLAVAKKVLDTKVITMSKITEKFEKYFAKKMKTKYALMVNSGSSANLLAAFASKNPYRKLRVKQKDEALIPALCWSTSMWPLYQIGLKIKFLDVNPKTLNVDINEYIKNITSKTKLIMAVHVLGMSGEIDKLRSICKRKKIILIEDTCESLGAKFKKKNLGTFGDFGTFSFYYSHQITSGEGGMVVCNNKNDYNILYSLRAHGWTRNLKIKNLKTKLDKKFIFYNEGFNLRPTDIAASIALNQFKRLSLFKKQRENNRNKIIKYLKKDKNWNNQYLFQQYQKNSDPSWFGLPMLLNEKLIKKKKKILNFLDSRGIETRPIISGNFLNQPAIKKFKLNFNQKKCFGAEEIEKKGFFIGLHTSPIKNKDLKLIVKTLLSVEKL